MSVFDAEVVEWDDGNESHFAGHGISEWQVMDVLEDAEVAVPNRKQGSGQWLVLGYDRGGLALTIVVGYNSTRRTLRPITGWQTTPGERARYL
ncbi:hypothetical protein [Ferrimicrobium acidiphilum]|uniref:hypothetical protein n=1 Tax=Ferrimicrobium acidiphilum TaxID=121039 RepID=UPI0023EFF8FA|nr:hypothetical protein [Ferrimicrobium acidiphilum]